VRGSKLDHFTCGDLVGVTPNADAVQPQFDRVVDDQPKGSPFLAADSSSSSIIPKIARRIRSSENAR